jgi:hypothetical protein
MVHITSSGSFDKTEKFLSWIRRGDLYKTLEANARTGVSALASATPVDSGLTAASWGYEVKSGPGGATITWTNTNINDGVSIAIILQYGHGTGTGGYVQGRDYINPAIRPIFDKIADDVWRAVTSA